MAKPEGLGPRNHEEVESGSTLATTNGYMDEDGRATSFAEKGKAEKSLESG
jgi:hypothetical protein